ncbi:hypothetical protein PGB34_22230 [Xenophilus arseniciresistens]|uniref:Uncharacterized protein n=1 Tax=Xenophilus arseniciresistens TaxID=1283306 RepID=A0AAE3NG83_9BURK|nr:hypothetical protein [Xenophilus arseniciresistens]MDA7419099.1 hypothetical protein [Xenophilus arseniciresistens]
MKAWLHEKIAAVFWITLSLYAFMAGRGTPLEGYVTTAAGPVLLVTGVLALLTSSGEEG